MTKEETNAAGENSDSGDKRLEQIEKQNITLKGELTKYRKKADETDRKINDVLDQAKQTFAALEEFKSKNETLESELKVARQAANVAISGNENMQNELAKQLSVAQDEIARLQKEETDPAKITAQRQKFAEQQADRVNAIFDHTRSKVNQGKHRYKVMAPELQPMYMNSDYETVDEFRGMELKKRFGDNSGDLIKVEKVA